MSDQTYDKPVPGPEPAPEPAAEPTPAGPGLPGPEPAPAPSPGEPLLGGPADYQPAPPAAPAPQRPQRRGCGSLLVSALVGGLISAALVAGAGYAWVRSVGLGGKPGETVVKTVISSDGSASIEAVAAAVQPSVVNVRVVASTYDPFGGQQQVEGEGSGVIIRSDGYILTNNHVVDGAQRIVVRVGSEELDAKLVGTDPSSDLAVIRVTKKGLPAAQLGSSADLRIGQTVVAFGSPFGLDKTVTSGIVSALHRSNLQENRNTLTAYTNLIQTDAAINPGNSGGPLTDLLGRVVGINTLIQTGGAQQSAGIGFAIPIDYAKNVADQLIKTGKAEHPFMGVSTSDINSQTTPQGTSPVSEGALVEQVVPGSPADKAGIKAGDIIVKIGEQDIAGFADVFAAVRSYNVGERVRVELVGQNGARRTVEVTLVSDANR